MDYDIEDVIASRKFHAGEIIKNLELDIEYFRGMEDALKFAQRGDEFSSFSITRAVNLLDDYLELMNALAKQTEGNP